MSDSNLNENISNEQMDINVLNDESNIQNSPIKEKKILKNGSVLEMKIWEVSKSKSYPDGIRR